MTISKSLIQLMHGELLVESQPGHGSTFRCNLRLQICGHEPEVVVPEPPATELTPRIMLQRILVADDNRINQRVIAAMLKGFVAVIDVVDNGAQAVAAVATHHYDGVFMDCQMPELDGYQATRAIRAREAELKLSRLPIIALTAHALEGARQECLDAGMDDYLSKPIRENDLSGMISRIFGSRLPNPAHDPLTALRSILDTEDLREVAEAVLEEYPRLMHALLTAAEAGDHAGIARIGHSFKGSGASIEFEEVQQLGRDLELQAKSATPEALQVLIHRLHVVSDQTIQIFRNFLSGPHS